MISESAMTMAASPPAEHLTPPPALLLFRETERERPTTPGHPRMTAGDRRVGRAFQAAFVAAAALSTSTTGQEWTLNTTVYDPGAWQRQAYVANGYIGQRVPAAGMGYSEVPPQDAANMVGTQGWPLFTTRAVTALVAGFYDHQESTEGTNFPEITVGEQPISTLATWSSLYLTINGETYTPATPPEQISSWSQASSIQDGVVVTTFNWSPPSLSASINLTFTLFASRARPNLEVVRLDASGVPENATVTITNLLDGAGSFRTESAEAGVLYNTSDTIYSKVSPIGVANVTAWTTARLTFPRAASHNRTTDPAAEGCFAPASLGALNSSTAAQCTRVVPTRDGRISAVKWVGIASTDAFPDRELRTAYGEVLDASAEGYASVLAEHREAWNAVWSSADIIIPGDDTQSKQLQLATRASLFHLLANVRKGDEGRGLGDNSIAPSGLTSDSYAGEIFWDAETWMYPPLLALFPDFASSVNNFRYKQLAQAKRNAQAYDRRGALYPWTAARYGNCTGVGPCFNYEYHLNNDISEAHYQYFAATGNVTWLRQKGWPIISAVADMWASHVVYNETTRKYDTRNETDPDEYANFVDQAAFTNAGISVTMKHALQLAKVLGYDAPANWSTIAENITVLSDPSSGITLEYEGFNGSTEVKQADVVLLPYPLEFEQDGEQALADLDYYSLSTSAEGPGMTYSVFSIDASKLSRQGCSSWTYFLESSQPYSRAPYFQFSEQTIDDYARNGGTNPAFTFLTGHGGYLQALTHGFTGYRSRTGSLYLDPYLPPQLPEYTIKGLKWQGNEFDLRLTRNSTRVTRRRGTASTARVEIGAANTKAGNYSLAVGESLTVPTRRMGLLIDGNLAQCKTVLSNDTHFHLDASDIVPGQYALAAVDGSNATTWQPSNAGPSSLTVDLGSVQSVSKLHLNWGSQPPLSFNVQGGTALQNMTELVSRTDVSISVPYDPVAANNVALRTGNTTDVELGDKRPVRWVTLTIEGNQGTDAEAGGTVAEFAVIA